MIDTIFAFTFWGVSLTNWLGLLLYWIPLAFCTYGYTVRIWIRYQNDYQKRSAYESLSEEKKHYTNYSPSLTVGSIIGYALLCIVPIANLFAAIFDVAPKVFRGVLESLEKVFNQPLVPSRDKEE
jgi:hypothetical protein